MIQPMGLKTQSDAGFGELGDIARTGVVKLVPHARVFAPVPQLVGPPQRHELNIPISFQPLLLSALQKIGDINVICHQ